MNTNMRGTIIALAVGLLLSFGGVQSAFAADLVPPLTDCRPATRNINSVNCGATGWLIGTVSPNTLSCLPSPPAACSGSQVYNCETGACQCNTASFPCAGCTAGSVSAGAACGSPAGGVYSNTCNTSCTCPGGTTNCSNVCVSSACPAGTTFSCGGGCSTPYVMLAPSAQQTGSPNLAGNFTLNGALRLDGATGASTVGDMYMTSGKAIHVDNAAASSLVIGNWGAGGDVALHVRGSIYGRSGLGSGMALQVGDDAGIHDINWGNGISIRGAGDATVGGLQLGSGGGYLFGGSGGIGINTQVPTVGVPLTVYNNAAASASKATVVLDGTVAVGQSFAGLRLKHNVFTTGWGGDILAYDQGSFGTNLLFRVTPTGSSATTTPTERMRLGSNGNLGLGTRSGAVGYPIDVGSSAGTAIVSISDTIDPDFPATPTRLWTGTRLARNASTERWFLGMNDLDEDFVLTRNGVAGTEIWNVNNATGAMTINSPVTFTNTVNITGGGGMHCAEPKYTGITTATVDGNGAAGYSGMNSVCDAQFAGSHVCTPDEILRTIECAPGTLPNGAAFQGWVFNGPPGFTDPAPDDCNGWTTDLSTKWGAKWYFGNATGGTAGVTHCGNSAKVVCCK